MQLSKQVQENRVLSRDQLLERLVANASKRAYGIAFNLLRSSAAAEDAVQEALVSVCHSHGSLRDEHSAEAWFLQIVTTLCLRILRRRSLKKLVLGRLGQVEKVRSSASSDESALSVSQQTALLVERMQMLPTMQRCALTLRYAHELSVTEIANLMDIKTSTAKTHLVRGLRKLRIDYCSEGVNE